MVQVARLATGVVFLVLFAGLELHISAITNLLPGSYAGLSYTGYIGLGFLITGIASVAAAFSTPSRPRFSSAEIGPSGSGLQDPSSRAAAIMAMQSAQNGPAAAQARGSVFCTSCGKYSMAGSTSCQTCGAQLPGPQVSPPDV